MIITSLNKHKFTFLLDKILAVHKNGCPSVSKMTYQTSYTLDERVQKPNGGYDRVKYELYFDDKLKLKSISVSNDSTNDKINYTLSGTEDQKQVSKFVASFFERIADIENEHFKKLFAEYDTQADRGFKLEDLLDGEKEAEAEVKEEKQESTESIKVLKSNGTQTVDATEQFKREFKIMIKSITYTLLIVGSIIGCIYLITK